MGLQLNNTVFRNGTAGSLVKPGNCWLEFPDEDSITKNGEGRIAGVDNKGTDPADAEQLEQLRQFIYHYSVINGKNIGRSDGSDDIMNLNQVYFPLTANGACSFFCVAAISSTSPSGALVSQYDASDFNRFMFFTSGGYLQYWKNSTSFVAATTFNPADDVFRVYGFTRDTSYNVKIWSNNTQEDTGVDNTPFPNFQTRIGGRVNFPGNFIKADFVEVFIWDFELSAEERANLHLYLNLKYNLGI